MAERSRVIECSEKMHRVAQQAGGKVIGFREMVVYRQLLNKILFLTCFDERFQDATVEFIKIIRKNLEKNNRFEAVRLPLPGAGLPIINRIVNGHEWFEGGLLQWAFEGQMTAECCIIAHFDCGAFGGSEAFGYSYDVELQHWIGQLMMAKASINSRFPGVKINTYIVRVLENIGSDRALFEFRPVLDTVSEAIRLEAKYSQKHIAKKLIAACPDTIMRKVTHDQFGGEMHFRLNVPGGPNFFTQTDDYDLIKYLLNVPLNHCDVEEILILSHPNCTIGTFYPFSSETEKIAHFLHEGNKAKHIIHDLFPQCKKLIVRPIFCHTFTDENRPVVAFIEADDVR